MSHHWQLCIEAGTLSTSYIILAVVGLVILLGVLGHSGVQERADRLTGLGVLGGVGEGALDRNKI